MPLAREIVINMTPEGLVGTEEDGTKIPIGILQDGKPILRFRVFEDERENCEHCGGLFCIGEDDDRCLRCAKSHNECQGCLRNDAETCIECDYDWCEDCWESRLHRDECEAGTCSLVQLDPGKETP